MEQLLKSKVEQQYKGVIGTPKDCNILSKLIENNTERKLSSTTLRRIFGLLPSESKISKYNLDTLAIFCGSKDYHSFCSENTTQAPKYNQIPLLAEMQRVTHFTIKKMAKKSLTPFANTIPRYAFNRQLNEFIDSGYSFFSVTAPGGYGKSLALTHWVSGLDAQLYDCLYCTASDLAQLFSPLNLTLLLPDLKTEFTKSSLEYLMSNYSNSNKKLVIVLDGMDELSTNSKKAQELTDFFFDLVMEENSRAKIKIIISTREINWTNYISPRKSQKYNLNAAFWPNTEVESLLTLSNDEIRQIIEKNSRESSLPIFYGGITWVMREMLRIPINLHLYIYLASRYPEKEIITVYSLYKEYLKEMVFEAKYAEQKEDLIWQIIELVENKYDHFTTNKNELKDQFPIHLKRETNYFQAYQDLLLNGILMEEREENKYGIFTTLVRFKHQDFYFYFSTINLIKKHKGISYDLFLEVAQSKNSEDWKSSTAAALYEMAYFNEDFEAIENFCQLPESLLDSMKVQISVGNSFRVQNRIWEALVKKFAASKAGQQYFFEYFVDTNYLRSTYTYRIKEYLQHKDTNEAQLFGHSILFLSAFLNLDAQLCQKHHSIISSHTPDSNTHPWPIGRKVAYEILYTGFILGKTGDLYWDLIAHNRSLAYKYPNYLSNGLVEFELSIMVSLFLVKEYELLYKLLEEIELTYISKPKQVGFRKLLTKSQNSLPLLFLEYTKYKLGKPLSFDLPAELHKAMENYYSTYDDFQYLILLKWFLCDYYLDNDNHDKAHFYWSEAMEISKFAQYDFYIAFLLVNNPFKDTNIQNKGFKMLEGTGFKNELIIR